MFTSRKRNASRTRRTPVSEPLDRRLILDAPLMLASDGLVLATPAGDPLLEPAVFADRPPEADAPVPVIDPLPPEDDPLSPIGDPEGGDAMTASSSCCTACITYAVTVVNVLGVDEAFPLDKGKFKFTATASCRTGAPASITFGYTLSGAAEKNVDYEGPITAETVTVPLLNGYGEKEVEFSVKHDVIDEPTENARVNVTKTTVINPNATTAVWADGNVLDNDVEWAAGDPIEGTITTSDGENPGILVGHTLTLYLNAMDRDRLKDNGVWRDYYDDVTSGDNAEDYHVMWTASEGKFVLADGSEVTTAYGTDVTYLAPDYAEGQDSRNVTITATVDDFNRGDDVLGFDDQALQLQKQVKVAQVAVTVKQQGDLSDQYDGPDLPDETGGTKLGLVRHGTPAGCTWYAGNTELMGTVGAGGDQTGYRWVNKVKAKWEYEQNDDNDWGIDGRNDPDWVDDFDLAYQWTDTDTRSPDGPEGAETHKIFAFDSPGWNAGLDNKRNIAPNANWTGVRQDYRFECWVEHDGKKVSNVKPWRVQFELGVENGVWKVVGNPIPALA